MGAVGWEGLDGSLCIGMSPLGAAPASEAAGVWYGRYMFLASKVPFAPHIGCLCSGGWPCG